MTSPFADIPDIPTLGRRFQFINNGATKQNVTVCFQYIIFLTVTQSLYKQGGAIALSINRDIVVHTASVVEACLHYGVSRLIEIDSSNATKIDKTWDTKNEGHIHSFNDEEKIIWVKKEKIAQIYGNNPSSKYVNKAAHDIELIDDDLFDKAEKIREARNHIHFIGDDKQVSYPSEAAVTGYFDDAGEILDRIKATLTPQS